MSSSRLSRPNQTWALAYYNSFANPATPTTAELNDRRFVHLLSCALTEDGTEMTRGDSDTDNTITFCSIGNEETPTLASVTGNLTWLKDENTGGSGSTVDLTSIFNAAEALLGFQGIPYWLISRTGPDASQDINFAVGHKIKMASFETDYPTLVLEKGAPIRGAQQLIFTGSQNYNYTVAT